MGSSTLGLRRLCDRLLSSGYLRVSLRDYFFTSNTDISEILVLIPLTILVGLPVFTFFVLKYIVIPAKDKFLRQLPPVRRLLAYYVELPVAWILLLYTVPGFYNLIGYLATPYPPRAICYWGVQATEWLIMIHLATIFAVALILDATRCWFRTRKMVR